MKFIGVTGHYDPDILTYAVEHWPVDTVLMPVNPVEGVIGGFMDRTLPAAQKKGLGIIGMKVLGASTVHLPGAGYHARAAHQVCAVPARVDGHRRLLDAGRGTDAGGNRPDFRPDDPGRAG